MTHYWWSQSIFWIVELVQNRRFKKNHGRMLCECGRSFQKWTVFRVPKFSVHGLKIFIFVKDSIFPATVRIPDVGGQYCPCPVLVSFLSGFSGKSCPASVSCPDSRNPILSRFLEQMLSGVCLSDFFASILSADRILSGFLEKRLSAVCPDFLQK